jgi:hypothetical protein
MKSWNRSKEDWKAVPRREFAATRSLVLELRSNYVGARSLRSFTACIIHTENYAIVREYARTHFNVTLTFIPNEKKVALQRGGQQQYRRSGGAGDLAKAQSSVTKKSQRKPTSESSSSDFKSQRRALPPLPKRPRRKSPSPPPRASSEHDDSHDGKSSGVDNVGDDEVDDEELLEETEVGNRLFGARHSDGNGANDEGDQRRTSRATEQLPVETHARACMV